MCGFTIEDWLRVESAEGYGPSPIPHDRDGWIDFMLRIWLALDDSSKKAAILPLTEQHSSVLQAYSERMASLAVRNHDREHLFFGLLALGLDDWRFDYRENLLALCLLYDAALRIGVCPDDVFEEAARLLPENAAKGLRAYLRRDERGKSLEVMGYVVGSDADGFRYKRTW